MLSSALDQQNNISLNQAWQRLLVQLLTEGKLVAPRGLVTGEVVGNRIVFDASRPVVTVAERQLGYRFLCAEAAWIMDGDDRVETIAPYSKEISRFSDDGVKFFGAYGPKILDQREYVISTLAADRSSRQAVISIWRENPPTTRDVPCTLTLQWLIRDTSLHCVASMRSSDAWLGIPYDGFNFSMLTLGLLLELRRRFPADWSPVDLGTITLQLGSSHLYEKNFEAALNCAVSRNYRWGNRDGLMVPDYDITQLGSAEKLNSWNGLADHLWKRAKRVPTAVPLFSQLLETEK